MAITRKAPTFYTAEEWTSMIQDYQASGKTKKAWCQENGITLSSLHRWEQRLTAGTQENDGKSTRFVEVAVRRMVGTHGLSGGTMSTLTAGLPQFTIEYGRCRLHMNSGFSEEDLRKAMRVIRDVE